MHKNRLVELTQISGRSDRVGSRIKLPQKINAQTEEFSELETNIDRMISYNDQLDELRKQYKKNADPQKEKEILASVSVKTEENRKLMAYVESEIKKMAEKQKADFEKGDKSNTVNVTRIIQKAANAILEFKDLQEKFTLGMKDNIRRQANIIQGGSISEQQVQNIMTNPEKGQEMLRARLLNEPSVELENAVSDIIDKYNDIVLLEKTMHECLEMMQELALLVALTGQQLDNIENTIFQAADYTKNAQQKLQKSKQLHKSAKSKMCCLIMLLMALIGVILIPILITKLV